MDKKNIEGIFSIAKDKLLMSTVYESKLIVLNCHLEIKSSNQFKFFKNLGFSKGSMRSSLLLAESPTA